jgi:uridine kinase
MEEIEIFRIIEKRLEKIIGQKQKPVCVAINGIEGTGKTVLANKLTKFLKENGKRAIQVSIDGFHFNKERRYKQGRDSAKGYYEDSYDEVGFVEKVLIPSQNKNPKITIASHDLTTDKYLNINPIYIENNTIIITDGAYLFKPNYKNHWDLKIYLKTDFKTASLRGIKRDLSRLGGLKTTKEKYDNRYHKASQIYINENKPEEQADIIIDNTNFENLKITKNTDNSMYIP